MLWTHQHAAEGDVLRPDWPGPTELTLPDWPGLKELTWLTRPDWANPYPEVLLREIYTISRILRASESSLVPLEPNALQVPLPGVPAACRFVCISALDAYNGVLHHSRFGVLNPKGSIAPDFSPCCSHGTLLHSSLHKLSFEYLLKPPRSAAAAPPAHCVTAADVQVWMTGKRTVTPHSRVRAAVSVGLRQAAPGLSQHASQ